MANIIDKGQITLQGGAVMSWNITDDEVLTISGTLWHGSVTVVKDIKSEAKFRHLVLDESVQAIGIFNFSDWDYLEEVTLPSSIKCIEHAALFGCKNLKRVNLSDGLEIIGADSFSGCNSLETIILPATLKIIYEYAFAGCESLQEVVIPQGVKSIGDWAFEGCSSLEIVHLPVGVSKIEFDSFKGCDNLKAIYVPKDKMDYYKKRFPSDMHWLIVEEGSDLPVKPQN